MSGITDPLTLLYLSFKAIIPAFGWIAAGLTARRLSAASVPFFDWGQKFCFYLGMPVVLCISASRLDFFHLQASAYLVSGTLSFCLLVGAAYLFSVWRRYSPGHRGIVTQAAYRANLAIIGLALCASAFGQKGLVLAAMPIAIWTLLFNVIAVVLLGHTHGGHSSPGAVVKAMVTNPLIVGIAAGVLLSVTDVPIPDAVYRAGDGFADVVIPFALVCMGGAISMHSARESSEELVAATLWRLVVAPAAAVLLAVGFGVRGTELGVTFLLLGGPAAVACHVMVVAVGGNGRLAANIVMVTTLLAPVSLSMGLFALNYFLLL